MNNMVLGEKVNFSLEHVNHMEYRTCSACNGKGGYFDEDVCLGVCVDCDGAGTEHS